MSIDTGILTVEAALRQSRLPDAGRLPGKEILAVCALPDIRIRTMPELAQTTLSKLFGRRGCDCSPRAQELVNELLEEYGYEPLPYMPTYTSGR